MELDRSIREIAATLDPVKFFAFNLFPWTPLLLLKIVYECGFTTALNFLLNSLSLKLDPHDKLSQASALSSQTDDLEKL